MRFRTLGVAGLLIASVLIFPPLITQDARATTLYVGGAGPGNYVSIQDAIDNATAGDTVFVHSGVYFEHAVINKSISLAGEDRETTVIIGAQDEDTVSVTADWVNISDMRVISYWDHGIILDDVQECRLEDNVVRLMGGYGIYLKHASHSTIKGNDIRSTSSYGMYLGSARFNNIEDNTIRNNSYGMMVLYSDENVFAGNDVSSNRHVGIRVESSHDNDFISNNITANEGDGMWMYSSDHNSIRENNILDNGNTGIEIEFGSEHNSIYHNMFMNNTVNADDESSNRWSTYEEGNYWDDYPGQDDDGDGIGDTWHDIPGGDNQDRFPLMMSIARLDDRAFAVAGEPIDLGLYDRSFTGSGITKYWDIDASDGIQENFVGDPPDHSYATGGFYTVTLTIVAERGYSSSDTMNMTVADEILYSVQDGTEDVMDEQGQIVGGYGDIDVTNATLSRVGDLLLFEMTVVGEIRTTEIGSPLAHIYGFFIFLDENDDVTDVDDADFALSCTALWGVLSNETSGTGELVDVSGFGTPTLIAMIPLSLVDNRTAFDLNVMAAYYVGFDHSSETWDRAYLDWTEDPPEPRSDDAVMVLVATLLVVGAVAAVVVVAVLLRRREGSKQM